MLLDFVKRALCCPLQHKVDENRVNKCALDKTALIFATTVQIGV